MLDIIMMIIFVIILMGCTFYKAKINKDTDHFMSVDYTKCLKGIMCIVVVLVHIPVEQSNIIQDAIGSFGYVCVTLFFLFSAYGLMYCLENKENYIKDFLRKRLLVILIPYFISNIIAVLIKGNFESFQSVFFEILGINSFSFVTVLIIFYLVFYFVNLLIKNKKATWVLLILIPIVYSVLNYIFRWDRWFVEELGFSYGIIIYLTLRKLLKFMTNKKLIKTIIIGVVSIALGILYLKFKDISFWGEYIIKIILGIALITFILNFSQIVKIKNGILMFLGKISYEVYLLHGIVMFALSKTNITSSSLFIYLTIIITILVAYVLNKIDGVVIKRIKG